MSMIVRVFGRSIFHEHDSASIWSETLFHETDSWINWSETLDSASI